jgi:hypothetical protein
MEHGQLPSASFPGTRILIVVRRSETSLYHRLVRAWARPPEVSVILDRRQGERRREASGLEAARRWRAGRRTRPADFSRLGYYTVRLSTAAGAGS